MKRWGKMDKGMSQEWIVKERGKRELEGRLKSMESGGTREEGKNNVDCERRKSQRRGMKVQINEMREG